MQKFTYIVKQMKCFLKIRTGEMCMKNQYFHTKQPYLCKNPL